MRRLLLASLLVLEFVGPSLAATTPEPRVAPATFRDCDVCPEMVVIPPGSFRMGELHGSVYVWEKPVHAVHIGYSLAVGNSEVAFAEWAACVSGGGCEGYRLDDLGWGRGRRPAINVSWEDAKAYVKWLSRETGKTYRLLSEAEWEYAARGGTETRYPWGNSIGSLRRQTACGPPVSAASSESRKSRKA